MTGVTKEIATKREAEATQSPEAGTMPEEVSSILEEIRSEGVVTDQWLKEAASVLSEHIEAQAKRMEEAEAAAKYEAQRGADQMTRRLVAEATSTRLRDSLNSALLRLEGMLDRAEGVGGTVARYVQADRDFIERTRLALSETMQSQKD